MQPAPTSPALTPLPRSRAWYSAEIERFLAADPLTIEGELSRNCDNHQLIETQRAAWREEVAFLQQELRGLSGSIYLEFNIPRMGRRIDCVLLLGGVVFVVEFKVGENTYDRAAIEQVWDYALDLKNFHEASHAATLVPILIATGATTSPPLALQRDADLVYRPILLHPAAFRPFLNKCCASHSVGRTIESHSVATPNPPNSKFRIPHSELLRSSDWAASPYKPTPTILEAARALYGQHSVQDILRNEAEENVTQTVRRVETLLEEAKSQQKKTIIFVTGVPGAGKTLVGLQVATQHRHADEPTHAVYLSGNGPLVAVLTEALTRDEVQRRKAKGTKALKKDVEREVKSFIQIVHHFRDEAVQDAHRPPPEHVVIFDEAQRAWNLHKTVDFMKRKKGIAGFNQSEPEFLIRYMDRHPDWAVIICLVGGGQEINTGEAGIGAWLEAVNTRFPHWEMVISPRLTDSEYAAAHLNPGPALRCGTPPSATPLAHLIRPQGTANSEFRIQNSELAELPARATSPNIPNSSFLIPNSSPGPRLTFDNSLHLSVSMRSFRAENVSAFVKALLDCEADTARAALRQIGDKYPIAVTRDLDAAKRWIRARARGSERYGLVASSSGDRLKPHAIDVRVKPDPVPYFLNELTDVRSSYYMEDAATEFQIQGLELDWVLMTWDADFRYKQEGWGHFSFNKGDKWHRIKTADRQRYLKNAYRVLLTRARQGMVIFVPPGDPQDLTRLPAFYDPVFSYLTQLGVPALP